MTQIEVLVNHRNFNFTRLPPQMKHSLLLLNQYASFVDNQKRGSVYLGLSSNPRINIKLCFSMQIHKTKLTQIAMNYTLPEVANPMMWFLRVQLMTRGQMRFYHSKRPRVHLAKQCLNKISHFPCLGTMRISCS